MSPAIDASKKGSAALPGMLFLPDDFGSSFANPTNWISAFSSAVATQRCQTDSRGRRSDSITTF